MKKYLKYFLLFLLNFICRCNSQQGYFHSNLENRNVNLIIPNKVDENGKHISYNLTHISNHPNEKLHYSMEIYANKTIHMELKTSNDFIAPSLYIERHRRDLRSRSHHKHRQKCYYQGHVKGERHSKVALSACNGITGLISLPDGDYFIEPSNQHYHHHQYHPHIHHQNHHYHPNHHNHHHQIHNHDSANINNNINNNNNNNNENLNGGHPHVIYQRSTIKKKTKALKKNRRKLRRKLVKSNCGTRELNVRKEISIEWQPQGKVMVQKGKKSRGGNRNIKQNHQQQQNHHNHTQNKHHRRIKRSISSPHHVEALVVADSSMVQFHQDANVEHYLLTIMNMVSTLYKDPTIGNLVKIVVVKIILLEEEDNSTLNATNLAESYLQNFCRWQKSENPKDEEDPHHHDVAILITRKDICSSSTGCTTLGVANVGGMCRPEKSCSVNEDNGITLAHTITHELGHNFGMLHDTELIGCQGRTGSTVHIMTPSFEADTVEVSWSNCSRRDITLFLDQGYGECLDDIPTEEAEEIFKYPDLPPGALYKAELQCRMQFNNSDDTITVCAQPDEICTQLWCMVDGNCVTQLRPAAPGTNCGKRKWCQNQKCVLVEEMPAPVDGDWGNWNEWSNCSRQCGGGISSQTRYCDNPTPAHGGSFCVGERIRYQICNQKPCAEEELSFRSEQCAKFNDEIYKGKLYKWLGHFDNYDPCQLYCTDSEETFIVGKGNSADGTPCEIGTNNMCIAGICRKVGCDWIVDSNKTEDKCGICGGKGESCKTIKGEYMQKFPVIDEYFHIVQIPRGSRHILIEEIAPSKNFLSIGKPNTNISYMNGNRNIVMPGEHIIAKAIGLYERKTDQEKLQIPGPIKHDISVNVLIRTKKNPGIRYKYTLPANFTIEPVFYWKLGDWSACSATCGGGIQKRSAICYQESKGIVEDEMCWSNAINTQPSEKMRACNEDSCPSHWWIGPWQLCSITCKKRNQSHPLRSRSIMCVDQNKIALPDLMCKEEKKPADTEPCSSDIPFCQHDDYNNSFEKNLV